MRLRPGEPVRIEPSMNTSAVVRRLAPASRRGRIALALALCAGLPLATGAFALTAFPTAEPVARAVTWLFGAEYLGREGVVIQQGDSDCGITALQMALATRGVPAAALDSARAAAIRGDGSSLLELQQLAERNGVRAEGWRMDLRTLARSPLPAVVHLGDHFAVVDHVMSDGRVVMRDPSLGRIRLSAEDFRDIWTGDVLVFPRLQPTPAPAAVPAPAGAR
jgi:predicted double-glycine peptidase